MQAVILAAGKGLRLRPFTETKPKALIPIADKPLLEYTLESLPGAITEIVIVIGYLGEQIVEHFGNDWHGIPITYVTQPELRGTGDALLVATDVLHDDFLVVNGDDLYEKDDLTKLLEFPMSILAWQSTTTTQFGLKHDDNGILQGFDATSTLVNCGAYHLNTTFFNEPLAPITVHEQTEYSLPHTLVTLAARTQVTVVPATMWLPVGTPQQLDFANNYFIKRRT